MSDMENMENMQDSEPLEMDYLFRRDIPLRIDIDKLLLALEQEAELELELESKEQEEEKDEKDEELIEEETGKKKDKDKDKEKEKDKSKDKSQKKETVVSETTEKSIDAPETKSIYGTQNPRMSTAEIRFLFSQLLVGATVPESLKKPVNFYDENEPVRERERTARPIDVSAEEEKEGKIGENRIGGLKDGESYEDALDHHGVKNLDKKKIEKSKSRNRFRQEQEMMAARRENAERQRAESLEQLNRQRTQDEYVRTQQEQAKEQARISRESTSGSRSETGRVESLEGENINQTRAFQQAQTEIEHRQREADRFQREQQEDARRAEESRTRQEERTRQSEEDQLWQNEERRQQAEQVERQSEETVRREEAGREEGIKAEQEQRLVAQRTEIERDAREREAQILVNEQAKEQEAQTYSSDQAKEQEARIYAQEQAKERDLAKEQSAEYVRQEQTRGKEAESLQQLVREREQKESESSQTAYQETIRKAEQERIKSRQEAELESLEQANQDSIQRKQEETAREQRRFEERSDTEKQEQRHAEEISESGKRERFETVSETERKRFEETTESERREQVQFESRQAEETGKRQRRFGKEEQVRREQETESLEKEQKRYEKESAKSKTAETETQERKRFEETEEKKKQTEDIRKQKEETVRQEQKSKQEEEKAGLEEKTGRAEEKRKRFESETKERLESERKEAGREKSLRENEAESLTEENRKIQREAEKKQEEKGKDEQSFEEKRKSRFETQSDKDEAKRREEIKAKQSELKEHQMAEGKESLRTQKAIPFETTSAIAGVAGQAVAGNKKKAKSIVSDDEESEIVTKKNDERVNTKSKEEEPVETRLNRKQARTLNKADRKIVDVEEIDQGTKQRIYNKQQETKAKRRRRNREEAIRSAEEQQKQNAAAYENSQQENLYGAYAEAEKKDTEYKYTNQIGRRDTRLYEDTPVMGPVNERTRSDIENRIMGAEGFAGASGFSQAVFHTTQEAYARRREATEKQLKAAQSEAIQEHAKELERQIFESEQQQTIQAEQQRTEEIRQKTETARRQTLETEQQKTAESRQTETLQEELKQQQSKQEERIQEQQRTEQQRTEQVKQEQRQAEYVSGQEAQTSAEEFKTQQTRREQAKQQAYSVEKQNAFESQKQEKEQLNRQEQLRQEQKTKQETTEKETLEKSRHDSIRQREERESIRQKEESDSIRQGNEIRRQFADRDKAMQNEEVLQEAKGKYFIRDGGDVKLTYGDRLTNTYAFGDGTGAMAGGAAATAFKRELEEKTRRREQAKKQAKEQSWQQQAETEKARQEEVDRLKTREQVERERERTVSEEIRSRAKHELEKEKVVQKQDERIRIQEAGNERVRMQTNEERIRQADQNEHIRTKEEQRIRTGEEIRQRRSKDLEEQTAHNQKTEQRAKKQAEKQQKKQAESLEKQNEEIREKAEQEEKTKTQSIQEEQAKEEKAREEKRTEQRREEENKAKQERQTQENAEEQQKEQEKEAKQEEQKKAEAKEQLEKEAIAKEQREQAEKSEITEKEISQNAYDEKEKEAIKLRHMEEEKAEYNQQEERNRKFTSKYQDGDSVTGYNVGKGGSGTAKGAYSVHGVGESITESAGVEEAAAKTTGQMSSGFSGLSSGGLASGISGAALSGMLGSDKKKDKEKDKKNRRDISMEGITTSSIAGVTSMAGSMIGGSGLNGISNISERHIKQTINEATGKYREDYKKKDEERDPYSERTEEDDLVEQALSPFRKKVDESKINTKINDFISHNVEGAMASKTKNMKVVSSLAMAAIPGAGAAAAAAGGMKAGAAKGLSQSQNSIYSKMEDDEPGMFSEEGGLRENKAQQERKKKDKLKNKKGIKGFRVTGTVLAVFLGVALLLSATANHQQEFDVAPAMSTVYYDSTKTNPDPMTQAANGILKSRFEAIKNRVIYGENLQGTGTGFDNSALNDLNPWQGPKYNLTEDQIESLAYACTAENGTEMGVVFEINQMLNLFELFHPEYGSVYEMVKNCSWYIGTTRTALVYHTSDRPTQSMIDSVRNAVNGGVRHLPPYVNEHDGKNDLLDYRPNMVRHVDTVTQDPSKFSGGGITWTFYAQADEYTDPFGYTKEAVDRAVAAGWRDELTAREPWNATGPCNYNPQNALNSYNSSSSNPATFNSQSPNTGIVFATVGSSNPNATQDLASQEGRPSGQSAPYQSSMNATITTDVFMQGCANTMEWARNNGVTYGDSQSKTRPCDDGFISCDRLIARTLWDLGFTDQPMPTSTPASAGITCGNMGEYLRNHGWIESHSFNDITYGSIVVVKHHNKSYWSHAFVAVSFDPSTYMSDRYDAGGPGLISKKQPLRSCGWGYRKDVVAVYNLPANGINTNLDPNSPGDGYDGSKNLPTIKCSAGKIIEENENGEEVKYELNEDDLEEVTEKGAMGLTYNYTYESDYVLVRKRYVEQIQYQDSVQAPYDYEEREFVEWRTATATTTDPETGATSTYTYSYPYRYKKWVKKADGSDIFYKGDKTEANRYQKFPFKYEDHTYTYHDSTGALKSVTKRYVKGVGDSAKEIRGDFWKKNSSIDPETGNSTSGTSGILRKSGELDNTINKTIQNYIETKENEPYEDPKVKDTFRNNLNALKDEEIVILGDPDTYKYPRAGEQPQDNVDNYIVHEGTERIDGVHSEHIEKLEIVNPTLTVEYMGKQRDVVGDVENWPEAFDRIYDKLVKDYVRYHDDEMYKRALFNILTIGTHNADPRNNEGELEGLINLGSIDPEDAKFAKNDPAQEEERVKKIEESFNGDSDEHDEEEYICVGARYPDKESSYEAKMGYLEYACDIMDASFKSIADIGFTVTYVLKEDPTQTVSWEVNQDGYEGTTSARKMVLQANITLYVNSAIDDIMEYIPRSDGEPFSVTEKEFLYEFYAPEFSMFEKRYGLSELVLAGGPTRLSPGDGGKLTGVAKQIYIYLYRKGLSDYCIAGILGNMAQECGGGELEGINPTLEEAKSGDGYGIIQWTYTSGRRYKLEEFAKERGVPYSNLYLQLDYLWQELFLNGEAWASSPGHPGETPEFDHEKRWITLEKFLRSESPTDAAANFCAGAEYCGTLKDVYDWEGGKLKEVRIPEAERAYKLIMSNNAFNLQNGSGAFAGGVDENGMLRVPYICQNADPPGGLWENGTWTHTDWPTTTFAADRSKRISSSGCGQCSTAMCLSYVLGRIVPPVEFMDNGMYIPDQGSNQDIGVFTANSYGVSAYRTSSFEEALKALQSGYPVMYHVGPQSIFTDYGHYIVLVGVTSDGRIGVNDPSHRDYTYWYNGTLHDRATIETARRDSNPEPFTIFGVGDSGGLTGSIQQTMQRTSGTYTESPQTTTEYQSHTARGNSEQVGSDKWVLKAYPADEDKEHTCILHSKMSNVKVNDRICIPSTSEVFFVREIRNEGKKLIDLYVSNNGDSYSELYNGYSEIYMVNGRSS